MDENAERVQRLKTIGLLGGMSWESTDLSYQQLNKSMQKIRKTAFCKNYLGQC